MNSNIYDRIEVQLIASCIYNKIDKSAKLYFFFNRAIYYNCYYNYSN